MLTLTELEVRSMLEELGLRSVDELFKDIPSQYLKDLELSPPLPLWEVESIIDGFTSNVKVFPRCNVFLGAGIYNHYIPAEVDAIASRGEFLTAYTPYQPEISQGSLQAMWEFQSMMCDLLGMDVCNASHYDGATATAEAVLMADRIKGKKVVALSSAINPLWKLVITTYARNLGISLNWLPYDQETGKTDLSSVKGLGDLSAVVIQQPNFFGVLEDLEEARRVASEASALLVVTNSEPLAWALISPPGRYDADIAVGSAQSFGIPMSYGGPSLGYMAARSEYIRKMPGRIIGRTVDADGRPAYSMILQTREQHIRREKATSNICTNQALMAIRVAVYLATLGKDGLRRLALHNWRKARFTLERLISSINEYVGSEVASLRFNGTFFNEFVLKLNGINTSKLSAILSESPVLAGFPLGTFYPELSDSLLITVTENNSEDSIELLGYVLKDLVRRMLIGSHKGAR